MEQICDYETSLGWPRWRGVVPKVCAQPFLIGFNLLDSTAVAVRKSAIPHSPNADRGRTKANSIGVALKFRKDVMFHNAEVDYYPHYVNG